MPQKKKKRKPRSRARGATPAPATGAPSEQPAQSPEKRRERLEARREAKAQAMVQRQRQQRRARLIRIVALVGSLAFIVWFLFLRTSIPDAIAGHEIEDYDTFTTESAAGTLHTDQPVENYASDPPVSGEHSPTPADCGVHGTEIPKENMVHSLEHGAVGILYRPDVEPEQIATIEEKVREYDSHVLSAPYPELQESFAIVAWAHLMRLTEYDADAVDEFIEVFREGGDSPEDQECPMAADESFQPEASPTADPTAAPTTDGETGGGGGGGGNNNDNDENS